MPIATTNPATGETLKSFDPHTPAEVESKLSAAVTAHEALKTLSFSERAEAMRALAGLLREDADDLARTITTEMGKTVAQAKSEVLKCATCCDYYAEHAESFLADDVVKTDASKAYRAYLPLGVVLAVMPWNYPLWQVIRFIVPALMAGNTGLLKHASNVPQCALALEGLVERAGFPEGAFGALLIGSDKVEGLLRDDRVAAATLTGSEGAGSAVGALCGELIKPSVLELGGSDAFIILPSADLDAAVETAVRSRTLNNGQSCIGAKRFIVHTDVFAEVKAKMIAAFEALRVGDPMNEGTDIGPLVDLKSRETLADQVDRSVTAGASVLTGCEVIDGPGAFYRPGLLEGIPRGSDVFHEEFFGPVAMLFEVADFDAAIELANDSPFGLGSSLWTTDAAEQQRGVREIEAGATFINSMTASDPRLPFGGIKRSGYGRELAAEGIRAFCNVKTVSIA